MTLRAEILCAEKAWFEALALVQPPHACASEPLLRIALATPAEAARAAWTIGNMHFPVELRGDCLLAEDDPILRQVLEREAIVFTATRTIFQPLGGAAGHRH